MPGDSAAGSEQMDRPTPYQTRLSRSGPSSQISNRPPKKQRIGVGMALALFFAAVVTDLAEGLMLFLNIIPGLGILASWFIAFAMGVVFLLWLMLLGVKYLDRNAGKKMFIMLGTSIWSLIPFLNGLPETTIGMVMLIYTIRKEDSSYTNEA